MEPMTLTGISRHEFMAFVADVTTIALRNQIDIAISNRESEFDMVVIMPLVVIEEGIEANYCDSDPALVYSRIVEAMENWGLRFTGDWYVFA